MPRPMPISVPPTDLNLVPVPNLRFRVPCAVPGQGPRLKKVPVPFLRGGTGLRHKKGGAFAPPAYQNFGITLNPNRSGTTGSTCGPVRVSINGLIRCSSENVGRVRSPQMLQDLGLAGDGPKS